MSPLDYLYITCSYCYAAECAKSAVGFQGVCTYHGIKYGICTFITLSSTAEIGVVAAVKRPSYFTIEQFYTSRVFAIIEPIPGLLKNYTSATDEAYLAETS